MRPFIPQQGQARTSLTCAPCELARYFGTGGKNQVRLSLSQSRTSANVKVADQPKSRAPRPVPLLESQHSQPASLPAKKNSPSILPPRSASQNSVFLTSFG